MLLSRVGYEGANDYKFKFGISNITEIGYADFMRGVGACGVCQPGATSLGHEPRIIPAVYVKPFVKGQKNDYNDAEAALRPNLRVVQEKSQHQSCRPVTALGRDWFPAGPRRSTRSEPF